jgi:hypothetical protein
VLQLPRQSPATSISPLTIESRIHVIRNVRVMVDSDLAGLYGVPVKRLNEQVNRNADRFPEDFAFVLTENEFASLRSQIATSKTGRGGRRYLPRVFTEQGVAMLSSVLRSETAVKVNIEIMRAFIRMRRLFAVPGEFVAQLQELSETVKLHDGQIKAIIDALQKMMAPATDEKPNRRIGFITDHETEEQP